jgi:predicted ester cyclase
MLQNQGGERQPMDGFPERYADIVNYIVRITREIWIDGAIGLIYDTYDPNCVVYTAADVARGVESVVASTVVSMATFPDLDNHFLNVAWSGDAASGFYTSHLGFGTGLNVGPTAYGPATGRTATIRFCADCISLDGRIHTEWLARDNGALVRQLGFDLHDAARRLAAVPPRELYVREAPSRLEGQTPPQVLEPLSDKLEDRFRSLFHNLWNCRRFDLLTEHYVTDVQIHTAGGRVANGIPALRALHLNLLASMPDATMTIGHVCWSDETDGVIAAVRWELQGTSRAGGWLGEMPSGLPVAVPGMTHCRLDDAGKIVEEWTVFDEVAVLAQIYRSAE